MTTDSPSTTEKGRFLDALASGLSVTGAAREAGVHRTTPYNWRDADPEFAKAWDAAAEAGADLLEDEAWRRAFRGTEKPVYQGGVLVGTTTEYSDLLLIFLLKGRRPNKYRENSRIEFEGKLTLESLVLASMTTAAALEAPVLEGTAVETRLLRDAR